MEGPPREGRPFSVLGGLKGATNRRRREPVTCGQLLGVGQLPARKRPDLRLSLRVVEVAELGAGAAGDLCHLVAGLEAVYQHPTRCSDLVEKARQRARLFSWNTVADVVFGIYEKI